MDGLNPKQIAEAIGSTAEAVQKRKERVFKWLRPIVLQLDELIDNLSPSDRNIMELYMDDHSIELICDRLSVSKSTVETCVKLVVEQWKKIAH